MGLLAPLFLAGALAIGLPFWLHRLQSQSSERQPFGSTMFLQETEQRVHVQRKLKYLVLLGLRVALLVLLALAFAKPYWQRVALAQADAEAGSTLVVVDTSVSMRRTGVFEQAQSVARAVIDDIDADVNLQLVSADSRISLRTDLQVDKSPHRAALTSLSPSDLRLDYGEMVTALDQLAATLPKPVALHLVSDFQLSSMPVRFADLIAPNIDTFAAHTVGTGDPANWSLDGVRQTAAGVEVRVSGHGDRERVADLQVSLNDVVIATQGLTGPGSNTLQFALPELESGDNRLHARIESDDDLQSDDHRFFVIDNAPPTDVPLITVDPAGLPAVYITAALESAAQQNFRVQTFLAGQFDLRALSRYQWLVIDDIGLVDTAMAAALATFLAGGGNVLAFAGDRAAGQEVIPLTGHRHQSASVENRGADFLTIGQIDTGHPALARSSGWHDVNVSRSMPVSLLANDQVLVRLDNSEPFLLEHRVGRGRMLLLLGGLDNQWNDLPIRPVFVSFIVESANYLSGLNDIPRAYVAGASLPLNLVGSASGQVVDPDGDTVLSLADTTREQRIILNKPGFYDVYTPEGNMLIAVNIDPLESDPAVVSPDVLERWGRAISAQSTEPATSVSAPAAELAAPERQVELWRWLLLIATLVLVAESMLGNWYLQPRRMEKA